MLGVSGAGKHPETIALLLTQRILETPYVTGISNVVTGYNKVTRAFQFSWQVQTQFELSRSQTFPVKGKSSCLTQHPPSDRRV